MKWLTLCFAILTMSSYPVNAWDEVTHAYITEQIIEEIRIPELQNLLKNNRAEFLSGCWFTDSYQYTEDRINSLNPHHLDIYSNAYLNYLQKTDVKSQENYEKLVALFFGSIAHTTEDFWLDNILLHYPKSIGENLSGDMYNGVIAIKKHRYLNKKVVPYFPASDLFAMYSDADLIEAAYDTQAKFDDVFASLIAKQYEQMRLLKLLSFLASNQVQNESPWVSANIKSAPGGILSCVKNSARYLEAIWLTLHGQKSFGVLNMEFSPLDNRLGLLIGFDRPMVDQDQMNIVVLNSRQEPVQGVIKAFNFGGTQTRLVNLVYQFENSKAMADGECQLSIVADESDTAYFTAAFEVKQKVAGIHQAQDPRPAISSFGTGLFLFILCLGLAGVFWGISGVHQFSLASKPASMILPLWSQVLQRFLQLAGIAILGFGAYFLVTRGWLVVLNV